MADLLPDQGRIAVRERAGRLRWRVLMFWLLGLLAGGIETRVQLGLEDHWPSGWAFLATINVHWVLLAVTWFLICRKFPKEAPSA